MGPTAGPAASNHPLLQGNLFCNIYIHFFNCRNLVCAMRSLPWDEDVPRLVLLSPVGQPFTSTLGDLGDGEPSGTCSLWHPKRDVWEN